MAKIFSGLRSVWDGLFLDIDRQLLDPARLSAHMRARIFAVQAKEDFTRATAYPHKVLTAHNRVITPYKVWIYGRGGVKTNILEFSSQPRVIELKRQMAPVEKGAGPLMLDEQNGRFYLGSDRHRPLGEIDLKTERMLFSEAARFTYFFGDARPDNPLCLDEGTGAVYTQKNPANIRGHVKLGPIVHVGSGPIKK